MPNWDHIIVGQGLAGTLLGYKLLQAGRSVLFVDAGHKGAASSVAAGIMNPVTGRRYVKSWMVDTLFPAAKSLYAEMAEHLGVEDYFHPAPIIRVLQSPSEENRWIMRATLPEYGSYVAEETEWGNYEGKVEPPYSSFQLEGGGRVDVGRLVREYRRKWTQEGRLLEETFDFDALEADGQAARYGQHKADSLIFCEGYRAADNPYFSYLSHWPTKGEVLLVRIPGARFQRLLKHKLFIVPFGGDTYWVGATNEQGRADETPTEANRNFLERKLKAFLKTRFEVLEHWAAVRPTVRDRRPYLGRHPKYRNLCIFNGLGTKGASLGPYWAEQMRRHIIDGEALSNEVDIARLPFTGKQSEG